MRLSSEQKNTLALIQEFVGGQQDCCVLQGGAGTGKTTLLAALANWLHKENRSYAFLAPTGRAARILGDKTGAETSTIHQHIYSFAQLLVFEEAETKNDPGIRLRFTLKGDDPGSAVIVVDEASMVGDLAEKQDVLRFGSGRLLADLVEYTRIGRPGRSGADPGAKLLFVGDPAQLPPVGQPISPALSSEYLSREYGLSCTDLELTDVHRQEAGSAILERATKIRQAIQTQCFNQFSLAPSDGTIVSEGVLDSIERVARSYQVPGSSGVLVTYTNAKAAALNRAIRGRLWGNEEADLQRGDQLLVNRNSPRCGLYNGDLVRIRAISGTPDQRAVALRGLPPVTLSFRKATVAYRDAADVVRQMDCLLLENLLNSRERALPPEEQRALVVDFRQRHPNLKPNTEAFSLALKDDPWFNALQVKYGYALTCHKAQGGEWDTAVVNFESGRGAHNADFFRWAYTAITRAKRTLVTIGAPVFDAYSAMEWGVAASSAHTAQHALALNDDGESAADPDWDRYSFSSNQAALFEYHRKVRDALQAQKIRIDGLDHLSYSERYRIERDGRFAGVQYWYKGNGRVSRIAAANGHRSGDAGLAEVAVRALQDALLQDETTDSELLAEPFLRAFVERLEQMTADAGLRILSKQALSYRLRIELTDGVRHGTLDFCYDGTPKWTQVQEVGGLGKSQGLIDQVRSLQKG